MESKCINCGGKEFCESKSYAGVNACKDCGFLLAKMPVKALNVIVPVDPMDAMMCESCQ